MRVDVWKCLARAEFSRVTRCDARAKLSRALLLNAKAKQCMRELRRSWVRCSNVPLGAAKARYGKATQVHITHSNGKVTQNKVRQRRCRV